MGNKKFGQTVKVLREERGLTQSELAEEIELLCLGGGGQRKWKNILGDIEQGRKENIKLSEHVEPLALVFRLTQSEKVLFYASAGYVYSITREGKRKEFVYRLMEQCSYPSAVRTPLWDFVAFNQYHYTLWGHTPDTLEILREGEVGPNLLRILFDSSLQQTEVLGDKVLDRIIYAFRLSAFPYVYDERYQQIVDGMRRKSDVFDRRWRLAMDIQQESLVRFPSLRVRHQEFGLMEFLSSRTSPRYLGEDMDISIYLPLASSQEQYQKLNEKVEVNTVYFFDGVMKSFYGE